LPADFMLSGGALPPSAPPARPGDSEVSWGEINQLERTVSGDLGSRYGLIEDKRPTTLSGNAPRPLFWKRMLVAREDDGSIVGCVGVEASLFDPLSGAVLRSAQADRVLNTELDAMDDEEVNELFSQSTGVASLANLVLRRDKELLVKQFLTSYVPCALLANLAVSPSFRRSGLGRELVELAETNCGTWGIDDMLLQVEEVNGAARRLYESLGYKPTFRKEDATALRLSPSKGGLSFQPIENKELLREEESPTVTMIKRVTDD